MCTQKKLLGLMLPLMVGFDKLNSNSLIFILYDYFSVILKASNKIFVKEESAGQKGTSFAQMNRSENSNAKKVPTKDFNSCFVA